jgi:hypothetical protein
MQSPFFNLRPPYTLPSNIVYFHDWRYVNTGAYAWLGPNGESVPMLAPGPLPPMHYEYHEMPLGIRLEAQPARKSDCVLHAKNTGDMGLIGGSLIKEDEVYRLWTESWLMEHFQRGEAGQYNALRYTESDDGVHWKFPRVGRSKLRSKGYHNIVYGADLCAAHGFHGGCVFVDPSAPKSERYKAFYLGLVDRNQYAAYRKQRPRDVDPFVVRSLENREVSHSLYGATSPDGFCWKALPETLLGMFSDTANICEYDPVLKKYVAYVRTWFFHRRGIGRTTTDDFHRFPLPEEVFWPDATQAPHNTWYASAKTTVPGAPDYHIMFPLRWSLPTDRFEFHLAASPDNVVWGFVPGGPVCAPGEPGSWDAGVVNASKALVEWGNDRIGVLYCGSPVPHKYPRRPPFGGLAWAWWPKGRLVALRSPLEGSFALWPLQFKGRTVKLNFRTTMTGYIRVEARVDGKPLPRRSFGDCGPLTGDHLGRPVAWRGETDLGHKNGQAVELLFQLRNADLFSVEFQ